MMDIEQYLQDKERSPVAFLFHDAGDSVFHIDGTGLASMQFDCIEDETHTWANEVTQFPVENGGDITDNIRGKQRELSITGFISNSPIRGLIDEVTGFADRVLNGNKRTQDAYNQLKQLRDLKIPVNIATRFESYSNMAIESVIIRRQSENGDALIVDMSFREISIVATQTGTVPEGMGRNGAQSDNATKSRAGSKVDGGKSTGKVTTVADAPAPVRKQASGLFAILN